MIAVPEKTSHNFTIGRANERNEAVECQGKIHKLDLNMLEALADSLEFFEIHFRHQRSQSQPKFPFSCDRFTGFPRCPEMPPVVQPEKPRKMSTSVARRLEQD